MLPRSFSSVRGASSNSLDNSNHGSATSGRSTSRSPSSVKSIERKRPTFFTRGRTRSRAGSDKDDMSNKAPGGSTVGSL